MALSHTWNEFGSHLSLNYVLKSDKKAVEKGGNISQRYIICYLKSCEKNFRICVVWWGGGVKTITPREGTFSSIIFVFKSNEKIFWRESVGDKGYGFGNILIISFFIQINQSVLESLILVYKNTIKITHSNFTKKLDNID